MVGISCSLATCSRRRGRGQVGNLEGSTGPRRVVQSLWSGAAAVVHKLACPRPVSCPVSRTDRDDVEVIHVVVVTMRRSPAEGQPKPQARRNVGRVLQVLRDDKTVDIGRTSARPRNAPRTP